MARPIKERVIVSQAKQLFQTFFQLHSQNEADSGDRLPRSHVRTLRRGWRILLRKFIQSY